MMPSPRILSFEVPTGDDYPIRADLYPPERQPAPAVVILCHGFKSHRRWGFLPDLAEGLREAGLAAVSMDFSMNGRSRGFRSGSDRQAPFNDPEAFGRNTISRELSDLAALVRVVRRTWLDGQIAPDAPLGLFGHSRGALISLITALELDCFKAVCTWATPADANFFTAEQKAKWRREGAYSFTDASDGLSLSLDIGYLHDLEQNAGRYNLSARIGRLSAPHLMVHGTQDLVVPLASAELIHQSSGRPDHSRVLALTTGHTFGYTNKENRAAPAYRAARENTIDWFRKFL